jgi:hypothetical protein
MPNRPEGRIRFHECQIERSPDDRLSARVVLVDGAEQSYTGTAERPHTEGGDLWCAAEATVVALREFLGLDADALTVRDVVAFDIGASPAVAVSLQAVVEGEKRKLFGLCQADEDHGRAAALAVLSGTNRFFTS